MVVFRFLSSLLDALSGLYFYLFDQYVIYPVLNYLSRKMSIRFMNLGYAPLPTEKRLKAIDENYEPSEHVRAHCYLYEKCLSLCPSYPNFRGLSLVEIGCGLGGGLKWIRRYVLES